jgi:tetratricopeptide (TPR) repeat protein
MRTFYILFLCLPALLFGQSQFEVVEQLFEKKEFVKTQEILSKYVASNPNDVKGLELLGDAYTYQKKWDDAIVHYKKLTELDDNNANYYYKYGGALGMKALGVNKMSALTFLGDIKKSFLKAAELDPKHIGTRWALVELYMQMPGIVGGSKSKSLKYADELEKLSPVDGYLAKGFIYESDDEPESAENYYKKAIIVGGSMVCYDKLTTLYEKQKQPKKAIANIEVALEKHQHEFLYYQIGKMAAEYNVELDKGERNLMTFLQKYSEPDKTPKAWAHYRLAQIHKYKGNKAGALKYIDLAISEIPKNKPFEDEKELILKLK